MTLLSVVRASRICCGNPVEDFQELVDVCEGEFRDSTGSLHMYVHAGVPVLNVLLCVFLQTAEL